nr:unnamed protein product [Callosobruchus analis]
MSSASSSRRSCVNQPDVFCYICGEYMFQQNRRAITEFVKQAYLAYFGVKLGDQDKTWAPHLVCKTCTEQLRQWTTGKRKCLKFGVPMVWREPKNHVDDCYFCLANINGINRNNRHQWTYPNLDSAIRPIPHSDEIPIPTFHELPDISDNEHYSNFKTYHPLSYIRKLSNITANRLKMLDLNISFKYTNTLEQLTNDLVKKLSMSDYRTYSHELLTEFIEYFRDNPCLWKITSDDYKDKNMKFQAYNKLLEITPKVERDVTIDNIKKKINSLRAVYRKEHKKLRDSMRTGLATNQVYASNLGYYSQLEFLNDQRQGEQSADNINSEQDNESTLDAEYSENDTQNTSYNVSSPATPATSIGSSARRKRHADDEIGNTISLIGKGLEKPDDEYDVVGKNVAAKLRNMTTTPQGPAEKLINEVIFLGRFKRLTFNTGIQSPGLVQESQRPLIHIPAVSVQMQETQAFNLFQGSQTIDISDTLVEYLKFNNNN